MKKKSPQQKKSESYAKDRRSVYGNNAKAARKAVPRNKRQRSQAERRLVRQRLDDAAPPDSDRDAVADAAADAVTVKRRKAWQKWPDEPLGVVLRRKGKGTPPRGEVSPG
jgi:hypothetical protein